VHANLGHVKIMVSVITLQTAFNAGAKEIMKDGCAPVCSMQL